MELATMKKLLAVVSLFASTLTGCATMGFYGEPSGYLSNEAVLQRASAGPLETSHARGWKPATPASSPITTSRFRASWN